MDGRGKGGVVSIIRYQTPCVYTNVSQIKLCFDRHKSVVIDKRDHFFNSISNFVCIPNPFLVHLETGFYHQEFDHFLFLIVLLNCFPSFYSRCYETYSMRLLKF